MKIQELSFRIGSSAGVVSGIHQASDAARACYAFAHGAGAGMRHRFMQDMADVLGAAGIASLRYNFPYMELGGRRPDPPGILEATVRAAIDRAAELAGGSLLLAGGKSMGGRMTSQALAKRPDARVSGLVFFGFPLHQPGKPSIERAAHLHDVGLPMLFLQGTRDTLADIDLITDVCASLGERATLHVVTGADHSFAVLKRSGRTAADVYRELGTAVAEWAERVA